jgi:hypothetical protein
MKRCADVTPSGVSALRTYVRMEFPRVPHRSRDNFLLGICGYLDLLRVQLWLSARCGTRMAS